MSADHDILVSDLVIKLLHSIGIDRIYGSPGTTELSLVQSAARQGIEYFFALHDTVAVGMADGFARATNHISVVNLHSAQGLLNASGFIRVALRDSVPVLIVAGVPSTTYDIYEPNHYIPNLQQALTPITKWGWTVSNANTLVQVFTRAISISLSPPRGPTFVCIPQDILESPSSHSLEKFPQIVPGSGYYSVASQRNIERSAKAIARAKNPTIFAGYGAQNVVNWVETLADLVAAPIIAEAIDRGPQMHNVYCRTNHPLFLSFFDIRDRKIKERIERSDVLLFVGGKITYPKIIGELPRACTVIQLNNVLEEIGKFHRVDIPLVGNPESSLKRICDRARTEIEQKDLAEIISARKGVMAAEIAGYRSERDDELASVIMRKSPIVGMQLVKAMRESLPSNTIVVDDSQCMGHYLKHYYDFLEPHTLYGSMAGHIGWALSASLGVKQARHSEPVVCLVGDGSFMFGVQALAAAATFNIPVLVIVANNRGYISLKKELAVKWKLGSEIKQNLSLNQPAFDYALLAKSVGLGGIRVSDASDLNQAIQSGLGIVAQEHRACVIDVVMGDSLEDWGESWHVSQPKRVSVIDAKGV
jgi:benzoylformate decarboxylase